MRSACFEPIILDDDSEAESDFWIKIKKALERAEQIIQINYTTGGKMRALDFFMDWLTEQKKSEQIYIAKELLKNLEYFEHRDVMLEEIDRLDPHQLEEMKGYIRLDLKGFSSAKE